MKETDVVVEQFEELCHNEACDLFVERLMSDRREMDAILAYEAEVADFQQTLDALLEKWGGRRLLKVNHHQPCERKADDDLPF